jgi:hypothetical protein
MTILLMAAAQANRRICWHSNNKAVNCDGGMLLLSDLIEFCIVKVTTKKPAGRQFFT